MIEVSSWPDRHFQRSGKLAEPEQRARRRRLQRPAFQRSSGGQRRWPNQSDHLRQARPSSLRAIDHVVLIVDGLDDAVEWYAEVVGASRRRATCGKFGMVQLSLRRFDDRPCGCAAARKAHGRRPPVAGGRNMDHFCLEIGPVTKAAMEAHLKMHGLVIEEEGCAQAPRGRVTPGTFATRGIIRSS